MSAMILIVLCLVFGVLAKRVRKLPPETPRVLNAWVIDVALPALVLHVLHTAPIAEGAVGAAASMWLVFVVPVLLATLAIRRFGIARQRAGGLALGAGLGNTAFLGLAFLPALGGPSVLADATVVDQLGSFLALAFLALPAAAIWGGQALEPRAVAKKVLTFPPLVALVIALATRGVPYPAALDQVLERLGLTLTPIALTAVGFQLEARAVAEYRRELALGLLYKLVLAPLLALAWLRLVHGTLAPIDRVAVAQAGMPTMVTAGVLATEHGLEPRLVSTIIAVGLPLSFVTVTAIWWLTGG